MIMKLKWINKCSGETGYVKSIKAKAGHFENTFDIEEARNFRTDKEVEKAITSLCEIGEGEQNYFEVVE